MWSQEQIVRLQIEWQLLEGMWPGWKFENPNQGAIFSRSMVTNKNNSFLVKIIAGPRFPDEQPTLHITNPMPHVESTAHSDHTLGRDSNGQKICGYDNWSADNTLIQSALRLREWLEAYEASKETGKSISDFLD